MDNFKREEKYLVLKWEDIKKLPLNVVEDIKVAAGQISANRAIEGKKDNTYVVVNEDEPYAEIVWNLIETRKVNPKNRKMLGTDSMENILNKDSLGHALDDLSDTISSRFDDLEVVVLLWKEEDDVHHRAYGTILEVLGLIEEAKFMMCRENIGETRK